MYPSSKTVVVALLVLAVVGLGILAWVQAKFLIVTLGLLLLCIMALVLVVRRY